MEQEDNELDVSSPNVSLALTPAPVHIVQQQQQTQSSQSLGKDLRVVQLIDVVRERPELWSGDADEMSDEERKQQVKTWESIAEIIGFSDGVSTKRVWDQLQSEFMRPRGRPGRPTLPRKIYAEDMQWLVDFYDQRYIEILKQNSNASKDERAMKVFKDELLDETAENGVSDGQQQTAGQEWEIPEDANEPKIVLNKNGGERLQFQGHAYSRHRGDPQTRSIWRCVNYPKLGCKGRIYYGMGGFDVQVTQLHCPECVPFAPALPRKRKCDQSYGGGGSMRRYQKHEPALYPYHHQSKSEYDVADSQHIYYAEDDYYGGEFIPDTDGSVYVNGVDSGGGAAGQEVECGDIDENDLSHMPLQQQQSAAHVRDESAGFFSFDRVEVALEQERLREIRIKNRFLGRRLRLEEEKLRLDVDLAHLEVRKRALELDMMKQQLGKMNSNNHEVKEMS